MTSSREPSKARELRRELLARVDKHDGHWQWTGSVGVNSVPRFWFGGQEHSARKVAWEVFIGTPAPRRVQSVCGELCIRPQCLAPYRCTNPDHEPAPRGGCKTCYAARRRNFTCDCGTTVHQNSRTRHLQRCRGPVDDQPAPVAALSSTQDCVRDYQRGMTPERICEAYAVSPDTLAKRLYRQTERTPSEQELMWKLQALAQKVKR